MRIRRTLPAALLVLGLAAVPVPASAAGTTGAAAGEHYVALGDSYASGTGAGDYSDIACTRSENAYPALWAEANAPASFTFAACGGARIPDVLEDQIESLAPTTTLVSLSIGGNDSGFASTMLSCKYSTQSACERALEEAGTYVRNELPGELDALYATVRAKAPSAEVVVMGYPHLYREGGYCFGGLSSGKRSAVNDGSDLLNATIAGRAEAAGFAFADGRPAFAGHEICTDDPWISASNVHPTAEGHAAAYLPAFSAALGG
ncbi:MULTISPECIES: SGNH/GDSL hydrolase family protein [Streptomyces]|uniref:SGNH/GDSL hydrolase family protein n=1 Tax=Streptomyces lycii TaxID=2654337 RepID=A0ABQ7FC55_9ACTN|nr:MULTISPECIES: SGNH/GDSL hydrolase family protein [Streptomyces]KAF4406365.1 SGNH/GDSL hydrolase family protein [Streptomyces lycii]PGH46745.1 lipase [Streptomyces sp. Ru87]